MKINESGQITIPAELRTLLGLTAGQEVQVELSRDGILIQPMDTHRAQIAQWLRDEHGSELATLTTDQVMRLMQNDVP